MVARQWPAVSAATHILKFPAVAMVPRSVVVFLLLMQVVVVKAPSKPNVNYRIVGGFTGTIEHFPFMVSINDLEEGHLCCGTLVTTTWVLTAGHCLHPAFSLDRVSVVAGSTRVAKIDPRSEQVVRRPVAYVLHPDFLGEALINDVGLVLVDHPFPLGARIGLVPVVDHYRSLNGMTGEQCAVVGWGALKDLEELFVPQLQVASTPLVDPRECAVALGGDHVIREELSICTYSPEGLDACRGDAGGPLLCDGVQVGVTSWGIGCGQKNLPGVFSRIDTHADWIKFVTKSDVKARAATVTTPQPSAILLCLILLHAALACLVVSW